MTAPAHTVNADTPDEREALYVDIANRAQEITGRGIWPSTVKAVLEVAASVSAAAPDERDRRVAEQIAEQVIAMQDEYLPSLGLDPAWIAGWRAAMRHAAARIADRHRGRAPMTDADQARLVDLGLLISSLRGEARIADRPGQHDRLNAAADVVVDALEYIQHLTAERDALAAQLDALRAEATDSPEIEHLLALDGMLGYMKRVLADADWSDPFVKGYAQAYSDVAHVRGVVWLDWYQRDPEAAKGHGIDWDAIGALPDLGKHRIFPRPVADDEGGQE